MSFEFVAAAGSDLIPGFSCEVEWLCDELMWQQSVLCPDHHVMARATPSGLALLNPLLCVGVVNLPIGQLTLDFCLTTCPVSANAAEAA